MEKIEFILKFLNDECDQQEQHKFHAWLNSSEENQTYFKQIEKIWNTPDATLLQPDMAKAWSKITEKTGINYRPAEKDGSDHLKRKNSIIRWLPNSKLLKFAAVFLLTAVISYLLITRTVTPTVEMNDILVNKTEIKNITLTDGSRITLDAGSHFRFPEQFDVTNREVFLNGEGYFDIIPNPARPFIIHANDAVVTVLGTKFNVRAWSQSNKVIVAVEKGKVTLRSEKIATKESEVIISKSEMSEMTGTENPSQPRNVDVGEHISWLKREIYIRNAPLREVLDQLERWYDVEIHLSDSSYASNLVSVFIQKKPIEDMLHVIALMNNFNYEKQGKVITFSPAEENRRVTEGNTE